MVGSPRVRSMRRILHLVVTTAALAAAVQALAQDEAARRYPNRAVKIIVSAPPGGGLDIAARVIADRLTKMWGQPFVVENRPGAGGNLGAEAVAQAEPDGYTLLAAQPAPLTTNVVMYKKLSFDPSAFEPLAIMTSIPNTLTVRLDLPAASVAELIAYAKANPGKLNFGSQGVGTTPHLTGELFARLTGAKLNHAINAVLKEPEAAEHLRSMNMTPVGGAPDAAKIFIRQETERWGDVIRAAKISLD